MISSEPYNKRESKNDRKSFKSTNATVKPVAKDTNKTRRKETKKSVVGVTEKKATPKSHLKRDMKRPIKTMGKVDC